MATQGPPDVWAALKLPLGVDILVIRVADLGVGVEVDLMEVGLGVAVRVGPTVGPGAKRKNYSTVDTAQSVMLQMVSNSHGMDSSVPVKVVSTKALDNACPAHQPCPGAAHAQVRPHVPRAFQVPTTGIPHKTCANPALLLARGVALYAAVEPAAPNALWDTLK